jgi:hypothetical protein
MTPTALERVDINILNKLQKAASLTNAELDAGDLFSVTSLGRVKNTRYL